VFAVNQCVEMMIIRILVKMAAAQRLERFRASPPGGARGRALHSLTGSDSGPEGRKTSVCIFSFIKSPVLSEEQLYFNHDDKCSKQPIGSLLAHISSPPSSFGRVVGVLIV